jgi:hypothetical protein
VGHLGADDEAIRTVAELLAEADLRASEVAVEVRQEVGGFRVERGEAIAESVEYAITGQCPRGGIPIAGRTLAVDVIERSLEQEEDGNLVSGFYLHPLLVVLSNQAPCLAERAVLSEPAKHPGMAADIAAGPRPRRLLDVRGDGGRRLEDRHRVGGEGRTANGAHRERGGTCEKNLLPHW